MLYDLLMCHGIAAHATAYCIMCVSEHITHWGLYLWYDLLAKLNRIHFFLKCTQHLKT